jgi:hypothetical protein
VDKSNTRSEAQKPNRRMQDDRREFTKDVMDQNLKVVLIPRIKGFGGTELNEDIEWS